MTTPPVPKQQFLTLPRLQHNEVQARNLIAARVRGVGMQLQGRDWRLSMEPWIPGAVAPVPKADDWQLLLDWSGAPFELRLPASFGASLLAAQHDGLELPDWPEAFMASFLQSVLQEVTAHKALTKRGVVQVKALRRSAPPARGPGTEAKFLAHGFDLLLEEPEAESPLTIRLNLSTDSLGLMLIAGMSQAVVATTQAALDEHLPLRLRVEVGCTHLTAAELARLVPGDTVMLGHSWIDQGAGLWLGWDALGVRVVWEDDHLRVTHLLNSRGLSMPTDDHPTPAGDELHELDKVPLLLTFDLGERMLSLGDLRALQVGQVLEMGRPLSQAVSVRVNGALIGSGELVDIDGQLGVMLVSLGSADKA